MNYEALNDNIMLVELTCEDMKNFKLTYESLESDGEITSSAIKKILKEIKHNSVPREKITVEALPTNDGGCFFILTFSPTKKPRYKLKNPDSLWYCTQKLDNLLDLISLSDKFSQEKTHCQIFKFEGQYYLSLHPNHKRLYPLMREFGTVSAHPSQETVREFGEYLGQVKF